MTAIGRERIVEKKARLKKIYIYRAGEVIFLLLLAFYCAGELSFIPAPWTAVFAAVPKIPKRWLSFAAEVAVILGLALFEWARRDKSIGSRSLLTRVFETWKSASTVWIVGFFVLSGSWWTASSFLRYAALKSGFAMVIFTQAIWNTTQGAWFYSSIKGGICLLGDHFAPLLFLFALPYRIWPEPGVLLGIQAFAAASCVFPLARIVRKSGQSASWVILFCLAFILYLPVRNAVRCDFHPEVVAMPLLFWAFAFLDEKRSILASIFLALALMAKENMAIVAFAFGIYACIKKEKNLRFGVFWMLMSLLYFYAVVHFFIPKLSGSPYAYFDAMFAKWLQTGWRPFEQHIFQPSTFEYIARIYGPLAFTSALAPASFILTLPTLAQNILSNQMKTRSIYQYYTATLTPFVFISSVMALAKFRSYRRYAAYMIFLPSVFMSKASENFLMQRQWITIAPHASMVGKTLAGIPSTVSLCTDKFYASHAANRKKLYIYKHEGNSWKTQHADLVAIDREFLGHGLNNALNALKQDGYQIDFEKDGFYILKKQKTLVKRP